MPIPKRINEDLDSDIQALVWNKENHFEADEEGTKKTNRRFMTEQAQYNSAKDLGLGLLHWQTHVRALHIKAALNYRDATTSEWKLILDQWIAKDRAEGRGAIFTTDPEDFKHERKRLPTFWLGVMRAVLGKLKLELIEEETITTETARAEPIWDGQLIEMTPAWKKRNKCGQIDSTSTE